jgi:hypothetical protein
LFVLLAICGILAMSFCQRTFWRGCDAIKDVKKTAFALAAMLMLFGLARMVSGQNAPSTAASGHHKVQVNDRALGEKMAAGGARLIADYGGFQLYDAPDSMTHFPADKAELRDDYNLILLNARRLDTSTAQVKALRKPAGSFDGKRLHLVQFAGPIQPDWRQALLDAGAQIVSYIPHNTYLIYGDAAALAHAQAMAANTPHVQWEGVYLDEYKIHPSAKPGPVKIDQFAIQLMLDDAANAGTLKLIDQLKLAPMTRQRRVLNFVDVVARMAPGNLAQIAARPDVISIQPYETPRKLCERQDQIVAGNLSGDAPSGPGYLAWLQSHGFNQSQFEASGFSVDISDSGIDDGTTHPNHFGLYVDGDSANASRVIYNRLEGIPNPGSTLVGCSGHGNLNAHIVGGYDDRSGFPYADIAGYHYGLGVCPFAMLGSSVIFDPTNWTNPSFEDLMSQAYADGARISNNSWGDGPNEDGLYNVDSQEYDALVRDAQPEGSVNAAPGNQEMVIVFAAGNDGPTTESVSPPATGKNIISVGAAQNVQSFPGANDGADLGGTTDSQADNANAIVDFSSRGPCSDLRLKPDLVAPGTHVSGGVTQAANPGPDGTADPCFLDIGTNNIGVDGGSDRSIFFPDTGQQFYTASSGTSHSTPCVSGGCALARQYFINQGWTPPSPAMTKAWLMNAARYMNGPEANDTLWSVAQGMGEMDLGTAFDGAPRLLRDEEPGDMFTASGQTRAFTGVVANPKEPFRVTVAWTDAPGSTTGAAYNNDLDLTVTVGGKVYKGNVFNGAFSITGGSADPYDNVESVFLPAGVSGNFTVTISAASINSIGVPGAAGSVNQDFALVVYNVGSGISPPAPVILFPPDGWTTNSATLSMTGTGVPGATVMVNDGTNMVGQTTANSSGTFSLTLKNLSNGGHAFAASQNSGGVSSAFSTPASVMLVLTPIITAQPQSLPGFLRETVKISASAYGAAPLRFEWLKNGLKNPGANATSLTLPGLNSTSAASYQMIAANSYGAVTSQVAVLTLTPNPFFNLTGTYDGLFAQSNAQFESSGFLRLTLGALGSFSGHLLNAGGSYNFSGAFSLAGQAEVPVARGADAAPLIVDLNLDLTTNEQILGVVSNAEWSAPLQAGRATFGATNVFPAHGRFTMLFMNGRDGSESPGGDGYGTVSISTAGMATWSGFLADNTSVTVPAVSVSKFGQWPLYIPLYGKLGSLSGWITNVGASGTFTGEANWFRIGASGKLYPAGFTNTLSIAGSAFTPGTDKIPVLEPTNLVLTIGGDGLSSPLTNALTLYNSGKFVTNTEGVPKLTLSVAPGTGVISGHFLDPLTRMTTTIRGAVLQQQRYAAGFFLGTNATGLFYLNP